MKIRNLIMLLISLLIFPGTWLAAAPIRVSVLYFDNTGEAGQLDWLKKGFADMLLTDLSLSENITGIEREQLEKVLNEQRFSLSGMAGEDQSLEIGKLLSAELLLTGSFIESSGQLRIDCKLIDTESGELISAVKTSGPVEDLFTMETQPATAVFADLGFEVPEGIGLSKSESVTAAESYYKGMQLFDTGEYNKAIDYYRQAAVQDPEYAKPRSGIEESYKFLKDFKKMRYQREINKLLSEAEILRKRLNTEPWITYTDFIMTAYQNGMTDNTELTGQAEALGLLSGETPATCAWNLQNILLETAELAVEYFQDTELSAYTKAEIIEIARTGREKYKDDEFLPEVIYMELLVSYYDNKWTNSLSLCEELMLNYPDYRMMWAIEDFYENALAKLSGQ